MVNNIENADSPYLRLQQSCLALTAMSRLQQEPPANKNIKPSEYALLNSARNCITKKQDVEHSSKTSIFQKKEPSKIKFSLEDDDLSMMNISYDGMGGHSKLETFPVPNTRPALKNLIPKLTTKHKLKRPNPDSRERNLVKMLESMKDRINNLEIPEKLDNSKTGN